MQAQALYLTKEQLKKQESFVNGYLEDMQKVLDRNDVQARDIMVVTSKTLKVEKCLRELRETERELIELIYGHRY